MSIFARLFKKQSYKLPSDMDKEFEPLYNKCREYTMTSPGRMYGLYKAVEYAVNNRIPGDFVECGVWRGGSSMLMALSLLKFNNKAKRIYLYDTFEGMSKPTSKDKKISHNLKAIDKWKVLQKEGINEWCFAGLEEVKQNMLSTNYPKNKIVFVKGKVEETLAKKRPKRVSILRLDTDWYESTKIELEELYPLLSKNGVLIIDDYGSWQGAREAVDEYFKENNIKIFLNRVDEGRIGIKTF